MATINEYKNTKTINTVLKGGGVHKSRKYLKDSRQVIILVFVTAVVATSDFVTVVVATAFAVVIIAINVVFIVIVVIQRVFHGFGQAKFAYGGLILGPSLLPQLPLKTMLSLKVIKSDTKISNKLC